MLLKRSSATTTPISLLLIVIILTLNHSLALSELPDNIFLNCGSSGCSNRKDGRKWLGDIGSKFLATSQVSKVKSIKSIATDPYKTARISHKQFGYVFNVSPGPKFIRLYFHPNLYPGFKRNNDFFTVKAGPYTLLSNFSTSLTADSLGVNSFIKEFCVSMEENQPLIITFSPSTGSYAFVNGIEIISMPFGLYYPPGGIDVVGKKYPISVDKSVALEMVYRLNIGGSFVTSSEDTGLAREWSDDTIFFDKSDVQSVSTPIRIIYRSIPNYTAPQKVYQTSWAMALSKQANKGYNFTWKLTVDLGFRYLVRFHFCELNYEIEERIRLKFDIMINDQIAEANADVIKWSGGSGIAVFRDYVAMMEGDRMKGKQDLLVTLIPKWSNKDDLWTENTGTILKGLEVFKLSNPDNNLAGVNPMPMYQVLSSTMRVPKKYVYAHGGDFIATVVIIFITLVNIIVYQLRILGEQYSVNKISASPSEGLSRHFSLAEIRSATNNFDNLLVIGKGGFGFVYKGLIDGGTITVAIKRLNAKSEQGAVEFWTEIDMLTKLRHTHLVSLIGYCDEGREMILVYDYMEHGTLADHLYKVNNNGGTNLDLSWEQKLKICIGAARGLDYLHTGTRHGIIHRDVKTTNILLDSEWVAKVSDFGLCKFGTKNQSHVSTVVKGTFGYIDPKYFFSHRLTKKSDVYAFGVVLLEVLCGRKAVDLSLSEERHSLAFWAQDCIKEGKIDELVNPKLRNQISSPCLKVFTELAYKCLHRDPLDRPTMSDVVASLEGALISQNCNGESSSVQCEEEEEVSDDDLTFETDQLDGAPLTPMQEHENKFATNKGSNWKLSKAFQWSFGLLTNTFRGQWGSDSISDRLHLDASYILFRRFSIAEIRAATNNFNSNLRLAQNCFGPVYKGWIDNGTLEVAIKASIADIRAEKEARAEIIAQSQIHHTHVISLIGYCAEKDKLMLVYSYMANRSLHDQLYGHSPLPWTKRLDICIGAAKGLQYLHYGNTKRIIHRNFKPSNILLDENWVAKISDFGFSKVAMPDCTHMSTGVCGTFGYIDPEYVCHGQLTEKSDVYAFGVVLLEVVSARKSLVHWFRTCLWHKKIDRIIDPCLIGSISPECLMQFLKVAWNCLHDRRTKRPTMNTVVEDLQVALQLQQTWSIDNEIDSSSEEWIQFVIGGTYDNVLEYQHGKLMT